MGSQDKTPYQGRQSGKSSDRWFKTGSQPSGLHPKGNGASTGDGKTTDHSVLRSILKPVFKKATDK